MGEGLLKLSGRQIAQGGVQVLRIIDVIQETGDRESGIGKGFVLVEIDLLVFNGGIELPLCG